ncbi:hypothetical protein C8R43DRAFT_1132121 [Mycena crocata]|nr:hypothetical protein C8R43DRAFT_1132121 [Mycena crocata]
MGNEGNAGKPINLPQFTGNLGKLPPEAFPDVAHVTVTIPGTAPPNVPAGVRNPKTFLIVAAYLYALGVTEIEYGIDPVLVAFKKKSQAFTAQFKTQLVAYAQGAFPFNTPIGTTHPLDWWQALEGSEHGGVLASLALKLFSAVPHSMADERTVSVVTWMNTALRALMKVNTVFAYAMICAWNRNVAKQKALRDGTSKMRASARPFPEVRFYNIEAEIRKKQSSAKKDTPETESDGEEDDTPDVLDNAPIDSDDEDDPLGDAAATSDIPEGPPSKKDLLELPRKSRGASTSLNIGDSEVDLGALLLKDVLADEPVRVGSEPKRVATRDVDMDETEDDAPFVLVWA